MSLPSCDGPDDCKSADPRAKTHDRVLGYQPGPGCWERWTTVTTHYSDHNGLYDGVREMRPDLRFVPLLFGPAPDPESEATP